jgi:hypothetical protein
VKLTIDFRYAEFPYELWALGHMLGIIEPAIETLSAQDEAQTLRELQERGWADDEGEVNLAYKEIRHKRDFVLPRFLRELSDPDYQSQRDDVRAQLADLLR